MLWHLYIYRNGWSICQVSNYELNFVIGSPHLGGGTLNSFDDGATIQQPRVLCERLGVKWLPINCMFLANDNVGHLIFQHHTAHQQYLTFGATGLNLMSSQIPKQATFFLSFMAWHIFTSYLSMQNNIMTENSLWLSPVTHCPICPHSCSEESNTQSISAVSIRYNST